MKKVMVFGVFDGLHKGHDSFLHQAKELGDFLVAVAAPDNIVEELKNHPPQHKLEDRLEALDEQESVDEAVAGDSMMGKWDIISEYNPDIIALGYDQFELRDSLEAYRDENGLTIDIMMLEPFEPETYHSSMRED